MVTTTTIKVLIDNCVDSVSAIMQSVVKEDEIQWGDTTVKIPVVGYQRKPPLSSDQQWKQRQIECLPTIARMAREERIVLHTYNETRFEAWQRSGVFPRNFIGDLFEGIQFIEINPPVERSRIFQMEIGRYLQRNEVIDFCKWLQQPGVEALADKPAIRRRFPEFELNNLRQAERFRELCRGLSEKQYPDALHLWAGEVNGLNYFLTTDGKFIRAMTQSKKTDLPCMPISPEDLLNKLGVTDLDPLPFEPDQFYTIIGTPG